jgi:hypothetical protein
MVLLKILADLGFFFTFAGFFACLGGASFQTSLIALAVYSICFTGSYLLYKKENLRFLPLILMIIPFLLPGEKLADYIVAAIPAAYVMWLAVKELYIPEWDKQVSIFSVYWKIFLVFIAISILCGKSDIVAGLTIPCGSVTLAADVLLMRSLRHEKDVYCSQKYQIMNLGFIAVVGILAFFLSSDIFLSGVVAVLKCIYSYLISPIFMVIIYIILVVLKAVAWLLSFIKFKQSEKEMVEINTSGVQDMLKDAQDELTESSVNFERVMIALGIVIGCLITFFAFKYLSKRSGKKPDDMPLQDRRYYAEPASPKEPEPEKGTPVHRIRTLYKKFLKLCQNQGIEFSKSDTSFDVNYKCSTTFDKKATGELRDIYIEARYNDTATKDDVARVKELYSTIKKSAD